MVDRAKPRLLDLFCGAGGCSVGYARAGFEVVGVDINPQPNYPYVFLQQDALGLATQALIEDGEFAAIHASPPCQHYAGSTAWRGNRDDHPDLIGPIQELLRAAGLPYVIENVPDARRHLHHPLLICGTMLGLPVRRHRYFEAPWWPHPMMTPCQHRPGDFSFDHGGKQTESSYRHAMGCGWMTVVESRNAIPPAYCEFIGSYLLAHLNAERAAA